MRLSVWLQRVSAFRQGPPLGKDTIDCGAMVMPRQLEIIQVSEGGRHAHVGEGVNHCPSTSFVQHSDTGVWGS